jgi:hypothetical protein
MLILKYLDFTKEEIREILIEAGDEYFHVLIGDSAKENLTLAEKALVQCFRIISSKSPKMANTIAANIELIGQAIGIDEIKPLLKKIFYKKGG